MGVKVTSTGCSSTRVAVAKTGVSTRAAPTVNPKISRTKVTIIGGTQGPPGQSAPDNICSAPAIENITIGQPLYTDPLGSGVGLASSSALPRACFAGIAIADAAIGFAVNYRTSGCFELTTAEWDAVTGGSGGLSPGSTYFLDPTNGMLTTSPTDAGFLVQVGRALSSTEFAIEGDGPIRL